MAPFSQFSGEDVHYAESRLTLTNGIVCAFQRKGNESSNPDLSASKSELQRNSAALSREIRETCPYFVIFRPQTGLETTHCPTAKGAVVQAFLSRAHVQSGFKTPLGECNAITKLEFGPSGLTFVSALETALSALPISPFLDSFRFGDKPGIASHRAAQAVRAAWFTPFSSRQISN